MEITDTNLGRSSENNSLENYSFGIFSENGNISNAGTIKISGDKIIGIFGNNSEIINNSVIESKTGNNIIGILSKGKKGEAVNNGDINLSAEKNSVGMYLYNSLGINNINITVSSKGTAVGMYAIGK